MLTMPLMSGVKGTSRRVWLQDAEMESLKKLSEDTELDQTDVLSKIIRAGLMALAANGNTFSEPMRFALLAKHETNRLNETEKTAAKTANYRK